MVKGMQYFAIGLPGNQIISAPVGVPTGSGAVGRIIKNTITIMLILVIVLSLIFLILGGIQWITSGGDKNKVAAARAKITYAIIGLIVSLLAFFIVSLIGYFFHVNLLASATLLT
jgi:hypothetical protein